MTTPPDFEKPKKFVKQNLQRFSPRGLLLYFLPAALIPASIIALGKGQAGSVLINASGFAVYMTAAVLMRKGLKAEIKYQQNRLARRPPFPRKLTATTLVALTTGFIAWQGAQQSFSSALLYTAGAFFGMLFSYGLDPKKRPAVANAQGYTGEEILALLQESNNKIRKIETANQQIRNTELNRRIERICIIADAILAEIESDPRDFRHARKFLNVYLDGALQVTQGYARTHQHSQGGMLEQNFRNVLETIENVFTEQQQKLQEQEIFDLDVQIEVLNTQLKREGIL